MKTLLINAHPDFQNQNSYTAKLQDMFEERFKATFPDQNLTVLNLYATPLPRIEKNDLLGIWEKQAAGQPLVGMEQGQADLSAGLLQQFKEHHRIVIVSPLHNFNVTSRMKDYIDNIFLARETFRYTENGSEGLMTDDYKALLLQASGSIYSDGGRYTPYEFSYHYLKGIFQEFMGFDSFDIVRAEGTSVRSGEEVLTEAQIQLDQVFDKFYSFK